MWLTPCLSDTQPDTRFTGGGRRRLHYTWSSHLSHWRLNSSITRVKLVICYGLWHFWTKKRARLTPDIYYKCHRSCPCFLWRLLSILNDFGMFNKHIFVVILTSLQPTQRDLIEKSYSILFFFKDTILSKQTLRKSIIKLLSLLLRNPRMRVVIYSCWATLNSF